MIQREPIEDEGLNTAVYAELRARFVTGRVAIGHQLSTRKLAAELGVSATPVRDALSRLAGEGAIEIRSKRRGHIPPMTTRRFEETLRCRLLLEPEAAALALPHITPGRVEYLQRVDADLQRATIANLPDIYFELNYAFHFTIYTANGWGVMANVIESLWLQYGPMLGFAKTRLDTSGMFEFHRRALDAIIAGDEAELRSAIADDINDGVEAVRASTLGLADVAAGSRA